MSKLQGAKTTGETTNLRVLTFPVRKYPAHKCKVLIKFNGLTIKLLL